MSYIAGEPGWRYPGAGDEVPERQDAKILLLSKAGICTMGHWESNGFWIAWSPLPKRDATKESQIK